MTGYGKAVLETPRRKITVEVKSLNSKQADVNTRLPWLYKEKELEIRNMIIRRLERGKIDISISFDVMDDDQAPVINLNNVRSYFRQLKELSDELTPGREPDLLSIVMRLPETLKAEKAELTDEDWYLASGLIEEALGSADAYRAEEGRALQADLEK